MFGKKNKGGAWNAAREYSREIGSFGDLFKKASGHRIMARLLEAYRDETLGASKAAVVYGLGTGLGLAAGKAMAREMGARI